MGTQRNYGDPKVYYDEKRELWKVAIELEPHPVTGRRQRKYFTGRRKADVVRKKNKFLASPRLDSTPPEERPVREYLESWMENSMKRTLAPGTYQTYKSCIKTNIVPHIGHKRLCDLNADHVDYMLRQIGKEGKSTRTMEMTYRILAKALGDAERRGHVGIVATAAVNKPKVHSREAKALTIEQAGDLIRTSVEAGDPYATRYAFALLTGVRQGEALGLRWSYVDMDREQVDITWQLQRVKLKPGYKFSDDPDRFDVSPETKIEPLWQGMALLGTKTASSRRIIPLVGMMADALAVEKEGLARPNEWDLVWPGENGKPMDKKEDNRHWHNALERAGLPEIPIHSARHTTASLLHELGVPAFTIQQILGHSSYLTTQGYTHVDQRQTRQALAQLGSVLGLPDAS